MDWPAVSWDDPDVVVDVSNVVRADELPGRGAVDLDRVALLTSSLPSMRMSRLAWNFGRWPPLVAS